MRFSHLVIIWHWRDSIDPIDDAATSSTFAIDRFKVDEGTEAAQDWQGEDFSENGRALTLSRTWPRNKLQRGMDQQDHSKSRLFKLRSLQRHGQGSPFVERRGKQCLSEMSKDEVGCGS